MSDDETKASIWDDCEVIHTYVPEVILNARQGDPCSQEDFHRHLAQFTGTERYHADSGLLLTDGVKWLLDALQGYALLAAIGEHLQTIGREEGAFAVIDLSPDGAVTIHDGRRPRRHLGRAQLDVSLPCAVRLFTGAFDRYLVVMLAGEY